MRKRLVLIAVAVIAVPVAAQEARPRAQAQPQSSIRPGDDQLNCEQLTAESEQLQMELERMSAEINSAATEQMRTAQAAQAGQMASAMASMIPVIGPLIGRGAGMAAQAQMGRQTQQMMAMSERMMVRGGEISRRINRVEILRNARCRNADGIMMPTSAEAEATATAQDAPQQRAAGAPTP